MNTAVTISIILALASIVGVLMVGLFSMVKGGDFNKKYGNKLMQMRIALQGLALGLLALSYYLSET